MSKITIQAYVYEVTYGSATEYRLTSSDKMEDRWYTLIGPVTVEFEIPPAYNRVARQLANIEVAKAQARAEFQAKVAELNEQASKLQALEMSEAA